MCPAMMLGAIQKERESRFIQRIEGEHARVK
jgi:hypothetical protein